jgi:serine/threonine protein kinase
MTASERYQEVQELFLAALKVPAAERRAFLDERCHQDEWLQHEVESLLAEDARGSEFLRSGGVAARPAEVRLVLAAGTRVGPYEISEMIDAGGMGEVYRARDTKLRREVALKVLPESFVNDPERVARFRREAQVVASLNHPHIAAIYGLEESGGMLALVMELVDGPTLAARITSGPLAIEEALRISGQIIDALEAAHERGIVHRDLKPGNVKITSDGAVKVLDFGLAKVLNQSSILDSGSSLIATHEGMILGTAPYMSPEQARGPAVDRRTDIWAFGVMLYEMITGRRPFAGNSVAEVLASVVKDEPDLSRLPSGIAALVARCLTKDPRNRWGSMGDVRWALHELPKGPSTAVTPARRRQYLPWALAAFVTLAATAIWLWKPKASQPLMHVEITAPEGTTFGPVGWGQVAVSPDGRLLAFIATGKDGKRRLWLRSLESGAAAPLTGTENAGLIPAWSPDSRWLGFTANGKFQKIDVVAGGPPQVICEYAAGAAAWNSQGTILFGLRDHPLQQVPASGGKPASLFGLDDSRGETWQAGPAFLPDGHHFIYDSAANEGGFVLASLDGKTRRLLAPVQNGASRYAPSPQGGGWLLYRTNNQLFARPLDPDKGQFTGEAALISDSIVGGGPGFSVSANGVLAFRHMRASLSQLTWFDRAGKQLSMPGESGNLKYPRISPDQTMAAFVRTEAGNPDIWLLDVAQNKSTRFTSDRGRDDFSVWSSDSSRIIYFSQREDEQLLVERPANSTGAETVLFKIPGVSSESSGVLYVSKVPTGLSLMAGGSSQANGSGRAV